jgi:hypothetical protein
VKYHFVLLGQAHRVPLFERQHPEALRLRGKQLLLKPATADLGVLRVDLVLQLEVPPKDVPDVLEDLKVHLDETLVERDNKEAREHECALPPRIVDDTYVANCAEFIVADTLQHLMPLRAWLRYRRQLINEQEAVADRLDVRDLVSVRQHAMDALIFDQRDFEAIFAIAQPHFRQRVLRQILPEVPDALVRLDGHQMHGTFLRHGIRHPGEDFRHERQLRNGQGNL